MYGNKETLRSASANDLDLVETPVSDARIELMSEVSAFSTDELDHLKVLYQSVSNRKLLTVFRDLRTRLNRKSNGKNYVCLVTSIVAGGGASYVSSNLAAAIALDRTKTSLLIDGNLYAPSAERLLATEPVYGLTDYLYRDETKIEEIVYASGIPRLRVIPVGNNREGGAEYFSTRRMRNFIHSIRHRYQDRYIIIDSPPASDYAAETNLLADLCDFVVVVVPYGKVTEAQVLAGIDVLGKEKIAGVVYNN